jgi:hypothetical protein
MNTPKKNQTKGKISFPKIIITSLCVIVLGSYAYLVWYRNNAVQEEDVIVGQLEAAKKAKKQLIMNYAASLSVLDSLSGQTSLTEQHLVSINESISRLKRELAELLNSEVESKEQAREATDLVQQLNKEIAKLGSNVSKLRTENSRIFQEKEMLIKDKEKYKGLSDALQNETRLLTEKINAASTLSARSIEVRGIAYKNGKPAKVTNNPRKAKKFMLSFDVYNRIIPEGETDVFILIEDQDGELMSFPPYERVANLNATNNMQAYTALLRIKVEPGVETHIEYQWENLKELKHKRYAVGIYHNGYKIGETDLKINGRI